MNKTAINSIVIVGREDGASFQYDGPFHMERDGGYVEIPIPVDPDDAGIGKTTAESLTDREHDFALAWADGEVEASGVITAVDIIEGELLLRVDDAAYADTTLDVSEVDY